MEANISTGKQSRELYRIGKRLRKGDTTGEDTNPTGTAFAFLSLEGLSVS